VTTIAIIATVVVGGVRWVGPTAPPSAAPSTAIVMTTIAIIPTAVMGGDKSVRPTPAPLITIMIAAAGGGPTAIAFRDVVIARSPSSTSTSGVLEYAAAVVNVAPAALVIAVAASIGGGWHHS